MPATLNPEWSLVGGCIRNWRKFMKIHQDDLAVQLGITPTELGHIEHGRKALPSELKACLEAMGFVHPSNSGIPPTVGLATLQATYYLPAEFGRDKLTPSRAEVTIHSGWVDIVFTNGDIHPEVFKKMINKAKANITGDPNSTDFERVDSNGRVHWVIPKEKCIDEVRRIGIGWWEWVVGTIENTFYISGVFFDRSEQVCEPVCSHLLPQSGYINNRI